MSAPNSFNCSVCLDDLPTTDRISVGADFVCLGCFEDGIKPQFIAALDHEHGYPVSWGDQTLDALDYLHHLPIGFGVQWILKQSEYETLGSHRIYCKHNSCSGFLGGRLQSNYVLMVACIDCGGLSCRECGAAVTSNSEQHVCGDQDAVDGVDPLHGMKRGEDYQVCPSCSAPAILRDGCNSIRCGQASCLVWFCFCCGKQVQHEDKQHWKSGMPCPKWGKKGALNAIHDDGTHGFVDVDALARRQLPTRWQEDEEVSHMTTVVLEMLHVDAHFMFDARRKDNHAKAFLNIVHWLRPALEDHFRDLDVFSELHELTRVRDRYMRQQQSIEFEAMALDEERTDPNLLLALDLWRIRHRLLINRFDARIALAWEQIPPHFDRLAYRNLRWPNNVARSYDEAKAYHRRLDQMPEETRSPAEVLMHQLTKYIYETLRASVEILAVTDVDFARGQLDAFAARHKEAEAQLKVLETRHKTLWRRNTVVLLAWQDTQKRLARYKQQLKHKTQALVHAEAVPGA